MVKRFYTKNGLPLSEDKGLFSPSSMYDVVTVDEDHASEAEVGAQTIRLNLDREPRFYAWVAFQGGYYEILSAASNGAYANDPSYQRHSGTDRGKRLRPWRQLLQGLRRTKDQQLLTFGLSQQKGR